MPTKEEIRERAKGSMIIGWVLVGFAFLVLLFEPSSIQNGRKWVPGTGSGLLVSGLLLNLYGHRLGKSSL
jgi:hypothetical protein